MIVADTDVLIDFLSGADPGAELVAHHLGHGDLWTTVVSQFELMAGARSEKQEEVIRQLLRALPILPLIEGSAERAAAVRRALTAGGDTIGMADSLIAGIVLHQDATLLTRNRRHFERVEGLHLA